MFDWLFSSDLPLAVRFAAAFVVVLVLFMGGAALVHRLRNRGPRGSAGSRGRQARLGVLDGLAIDSRRSLVIVRRDNVEHLIMIGGPNDVVVESAIVRNAGAPREPAPSVELAVRGDGGRAAGPVGGGRGLQVPPPRAAVRQEPTLAPGRPPAPQPVPQQAPPQPAPQQPLPQQAAAPNLVAAPVAAQSVPQPGPPAPAVQPPAEPAGAEIPPQRRPQRPGGGGPPAPTAAAQPAAAAAPPGERPAERVAESRLQAGPRPVPRSDAPREGPAASPQPGSLLRPLRPALTPGRADPAIHATSSEQSTTPQHADPLFNDIAQRLEQALTPRPRPPQQAQAPAAPAAPAAPPPKPAPAPAAPPTVEAAPEPRVRSAFDSLEEEMASLLGREPKRPGG